MNSTEARAALNERRRTVALIMKNQEKLDSQIEGISEEYLRWAYLNQWLALEKLRCQLVGERDYRAAAQQNYTRHNFPCFHREKVQ